MPHDQRSEGIFDQLAGLLDRVAAPGGRPITRSTELYYDLGLAGDDLYEAINDIRAHFGTNFSGMKLAKYAPGETEALFSLDILREALGRPRRYHSLTVGDLENAVEAGSWDGD